MMHRTKHYLLGGLVMLLAASANAQQPTAPDSTETEMASGNGHFVVSYESRLQPIVINRMHSWVIHVENRAGETVEDAQLEVIGGMPVHDHGLPTLPQNTRHLGSGSYLVEGMKFHMNGWWQITVTITAADVADTVIFNLVL